jgi:hypothetical protein
MRADNEGYIRLAVQIKTANALAARVAAGGRAQLDLPPV